VSIQYNHDHDNEIAVFAETNFRNQPRRFGIKTDDRRRHMYTIGKTGMGKTNFLENLVYNDIMAGHGVGIVDPHGDFAERILEFVPSYRINDVVYVNPADMDHPIAFNILETVDETHKHLIASGLMGVFKKIWPDVWSARMEYILNNTVLALLDYPGSTLLGINRMLADPTFRKRVISKIHDPVVKAFWVNEFARYNERYASEAIAPIQNKVGQFLSTAIIRNIVGQVKSTIDVREIIDSGKIFIMNLSKGRMGEDNSRLLGGMLITKIQLATMERVDTPEEDRRDFYLYVDEFQNFATESFSNILSEARKYHLNLIVAHQYIEQLEEEVAAAVFGNVGTIVAFRVGGADALKMVPEFTPRFTEEDLVNLPKYNAYIKLMIDGVSSDPFSATILPPLGQSHHNREKVISVSRERYAQDRAVVEDKISRWSEGLLTEGPSESTVARNGEPRTEVRVARAPMPRSAPFVAPAPRRDLPAAQASAPLPPPTARTQPLARSEPTGPQYKCTRCSNMTTLTFTPDPKKPIYCKECLKIVREEQRQQKSAPTSAVSREDRPKNNPALADPIAAPAASISLSEAVRRPPTDFRGRQMSPGKSETSAKRNKPKPPVNRPIPAPPKAAPDQPGEPLADLFTTTTPAVQEAVPPPRTPPPPVVAPPSFAPPPIPTNTPQNTPRTVQQQPKVLKPGQSSKI